MTGYPEALTYLFGLQRIGIKLGLDNIIALLDSLGHPQKQYPAIHIAGTNGKGSTAAMLAAMLQSEGQKVALYTSPHLIDFSERITVNRVPIPRDTLVEMTIKLRPTIDAVQASFFEATTAIAFWYFAKMEVDIAVIETGLGGRLDATNVLQPLLTLITPINFDHQVYLGNTLAAIAGEKAGIIKTGIPCLTNNRDPEVLKVLDRCCRQHNCELVEVARVAEAHVHAMAFQGSLVDFRIADKTFENLSINLPGPHQVDNALLAVTAACRLPGAYRPSANAISDGLATVSWQGRIHRVSQHPELVVDVSHNPQGFVKTLAFIRQFYERERIHTFTFLQSDKDFETIADILIENTGSIGFIDLPDGKPLSPVLFLEAIKKRGGTAVLSKSVPDALQQVGKTDQPILWLFIGSHYLAGRVYAFLAQQNHQL